MKDTYKKAVISKNYIHFTDGKVSSSPLYDTVMENVVIEKKRPLCFSGDGIEYDLDFDTRYIDLEKYDEPIRKRLGIKYIPSGWAMLKKRTHIKHTCYRVLSITEHEDGSVTVGTGK